ncbi:MAG: hypothetical protein AB4080_20575 [Trichodesmium sp.]
MKNHLMKIVSITVGTILSYNIVNLKSVQGNNNLSNLFLANKITKTKIISKTLPEKTNWESKLLNSHNQTKLVQANVGKWQNNLHNKTYQPFIDPGIVLGVGLISVSYFFRKKRP